MALKTFNIDENTYGKFSKFCKEHGISMSKQIEIFIRSQVEDDLELKEEYIKKLDKIRNGNFIKVGDFSSFEKRYG